MRAVVVYVAASFAILQGADVVFPILDLPGWGIRLLFGLLLAGFPLVVVLAWVFELGTDGMRRTVRKSAVPVEGGHRWVGGRTVLAVGGLLVVGGASGWFLRPAVSGVGAAPDDAAPPSIAVLPFDNLSGDAETDPFVEGLHDDLLTQLSRIADLRVIARTSVKQYRGTDRTIRSIAEELGVRTVLEGGVQRSGDRIRLNVQLIDGATEDHLWAETYTRDLTPAEIFGIQGEVAAAITEALRAELTDEERERITTAPTDDLVAYELYLRALSDGFREPSSIPALEEAVRRDPDFAEAWALLSQAHTWVARLVSAGIPATGDPAAEARETLSRAREIDPDAVTTAVAEGYLRYYVDWDLRAAATAFRTALEAHPRSVEALEGRALVIRRMGRTEEALDLLLEAVELDPLSDGIVFVAIQTAGWAGRRSVAAQLFRRYRELTLSTQSADLAATWAWNVLGDTAQGRRIAERIPDPVLRRSEEAWLALVRRDPTSAWDLLGAWPALEDPDRPDFRSLRYYTRAHAATMLARPAVVRAAADSLLRSQGAPRYGLVGAPERRTEAALAGMRAIAHAFLRDDEAALEESARSVRLLPLEEDIVEGAIQALVQAEVLTRIGRPREAVAVLEELADRAGGHVEAPYLRLSPLWDPLRERADFLALVERVEREREAAVGR